MNTEGQGTGLICPPPHQKISDDSPHSRAPVCLECFSFHIKPGTLTGIQISLQDQTCPSLVSLLGDRGFCSEDWASDFRFFLKGLPVVVQVYPITKAMMSGALKQRMAIHNSHTYLIIKMYIWLMLLERDGGLFM